MIETSFDSTINLSLFMFMYQVVDHQKGRLTHETINVLAIFKQQ